MALSDENGEAVLKLPLRTQSFFRDNIEELFQLGAATIHPGNKIEKFKSVKVNKKKLDDIIENKVSFIKIDVEGFEGMVIRGALSWLRGISTQNKILPVFIVEVAWGHELHPYAEENFETYRELVSIGYCEIVLPVIYTMDVLFIPRKIDPSCSKYKLWEGGRI